MQIPASMTAAAHQGNINYVRYALRDCTLARLHSSNIEAYATCRQGKAVHSAVESELVACTGASGIANHHALLRIDVSGDMELQRTSRRFSNGMEWSRRALSIVLIRCAVDTK